MCGNGAARLRCLRGLEHVCSSRGRRRRQLPTNAQLSNTPKLPMPTPGPLEVEGGSGWELAVGSWEFSQSRILSPRLMRGPNPEDGACARLTYLPTSPRQAIRKGSRDLPAI